MPSLHNLRLSEYTNAVPRLGLFSVHFIGWDQFHTDNFKGGTSKKNTLHILNLLFRWSEQNLGGLLINSNIIQLSESTVALFSRWRILLPLDGAPGLGKRQQRRLKSWIGSAIMRLVLGWWWSVLQNLTSNPHYSYRKSKQVQSPYNLFKIPKSRQNRNQLNI